MFQGEIQLVHKLVRCSTLWNRINMFKKILATTTASLPGHIMNRMQESSIVIPNEQMTGKTQGKGNLKPFAISDKNL